MASLNTIWSVAPNKGLFIDSNTNQFIISGYRLIVDPLLNRDTLKVTAPSTSDSIGERGNVAFDDHHLYYCIGTNKWVRSKLAYWSEENNEGVTPGITTPGQTYIPVPTNSWKFTSNGSDGIGDYHFYSYFNTKFDPVSGFSNISLYSIPNLNLGYLLNHTSNLIEPSKLSEDFTLSFETIRPSTKPGLPYTFFMGSPFGKLGFYLNWINPNGSKAARGDYQTTGNHLQFSFNTHNTVSGATNFTFRWLAQPTLTAPSKTQFCQVVATHQASTKEVKLYVDGILQSSANYQTPYMLAGQKVGSIYENPKYQGWGIGASPAGSNGSPAMQTEYVSKIDALRYMLFWKGTALNQAQVTQLYNNGNFIRYQYGRTIAGLNGTYTMRGFE